MIRINLVDYLGIHSGMDYYLEAFHKVLETLPDADVRILSNYPFGKEKKPFFVNQYKGNPISKGMALMGNLHRLRSYVGKHGDEVYVYLTYGNPIDLLFMRIISKAPFHVIDIHEAIAQNVDDNKRLQGYFRSMYSRKVKTVISHSGRTDDFLHQYGYKGMVMNVPHFKYVFPRDYDLSNVDEKMVSAVGEGKVNLLFFGNLNRSKGVDILLDAFNRLDPSVADRLNVIIAGKDFDGSVWEVKPADGRNVHIFARHISDDELRFLYQSVDYLCLPYRKTSQSGILEMAFYFRKPIIASNLPYFEKTLAEFPSFGLLAGNGPEDYARALENIAKAGKDPSSFFADEDYARYENRREIEEFKKDFESWLKRIK